MALTTRGVNAFSNPSRATRQQIPPFLSKLFHMVNDPKTDNLIRWSDAGDSFYVYDHERFAKEVLPHWFKHGNFGSFVRQLNNYGFHKVPHLQQGVLRSDGEAEISHFENQYFQRGQSDLLCLIQRKKQGTNDIREESPDLKEPVAGVSAVSNGAESGSNHASHNVKGAVIDANGLLNGIQAIKRHQHAISAELKELHQSNQGLWQEAYAARERHKKHHDTITRILKFLAGVFGQAAGSPRAQEVPRSDSPDNNPGAVVTRRPTRLMIENGADASAKANEVLNGHLDLNDFMEPLDFEGGQANDGDRFSVVDSVLSPVPSVTTPAPVTPSIVGTSGGDSISVSELSSKEALFNKPTSSDAASTSQEPSTVPLTGTNPSNHNRLPSPDISQMYNSFTIQDANTSALTASAPSNTQPDLNVPNQFSSILSNPAHLQRIISAALQAQQLPVSLPPDPGPEPMNFPNDGNNLSMPPMTDLSNFSFPPDGQLSPGSTLSLLSAVGGNNMAGFPIIMPGDDTATLNALAHSSNQLRKSYKEAADVEADVNNVEHQLYTFIKTLGIDPTSPLVQGEGGQGQEDEIVNKQTDESTQHHDTPNLNVNDDFIAFDSFLTPDFHATNPAAMMADLEVHDVDHFGAFLDDVKSVSGASDVTIESDTVTADGIQSKGGRGSTKEKKRKSDVVENSMPKKAKR